MSQKLNNDYITHKPYEYYEILGLRKEATATDIKNAFKSLAKMMHPDKVPVSERVKAHERFTKINKAYEILSDPEKKHKYDELYSTFSNNANLNTPTNPSATPTYTPRSTPYSYSYSYSYTSTTNRTERNGSNTFFSTSTNDNNPSPQNSSSNSNASFSGNTNSDDLKKYNTKIFFDFRKYFRFNDLYHFPNFLSKYVQYALSSASSYYKNLVLKGVFEGTFQVFKSLSMHPVLCFWDIFVVETISRVSNDTSFLNIASPILMTAVYPFFLDFTLRSSTLPNKTFLFSIYKKTGFFGLWTGFGGLILQFIAFRFASTLLDEIIEKLDNRFGLPQIHRANFFPIQLRYQMSHIQQAYFIFSRIIRSLGITAIALPFKNELFLKQLSLLSVQPSWFRSLVTENKNWNHPFKGFGFDFIFTLFTGRMLF